MNRQHPFFSPVGCLGGGVLILGLALAIVFTGGAIFSPGELTAQAAHRTPLQGFTSHAEFQTDCGQCHAPFAGVAADRCERCHTGTAAERAQGNGVHGRLSPEAALECGACHDDHEGAAHDPNALAVRLFDHASTGFDLGRHVVDYANAPLECQGCHTLPGYEFVADRCATCHAGQAADFMTGHLLAFGPTCLACHDGVDQTTGFDHAQTALPLTGEHAALSCAACHQPKTPPTETPADCAACHAEPALHAGVFSADCATCHSAAGWQPAQLPDGRPFAHAQTAFQLTHHRQGFDGAPLTCAACHAGPEFAVLTQTCVDCHSPQDAAFMTAHVETFGMSCVSCHDGAGNMQGFDHAQVFALEGAHAALTCAACHEGQRFRGTPAACAACHQEPASHAGLFGAACQACHVASGWLPARLTQHTFPLDHGEQGEIPCATCHTASYTAYTCFGCHEHEANQIRQEHNEVDLSLQPLENCAACHATGEEKEE